MSTSITQFNHLRISLKEIKKATKNFSKKYIIGKGGFGNVYKGYLLRSGEYIKFSARRLDRSQGLGDIEFLTELSVLSSLKHPNIVSLIGFCDEKGEKVIITSHEAMGSLSKYLSDPALTWIQRLKICHGVAEAIHYIHYEKGRNYSIIHQNITSDTILLDDNFEAKLSGFEFSITDSVDRIERYIRPVARQNPGYTDPETLKTGPPTQKSDIYSFGIVLSEIMCGKTISTQKNAYPDNFAAPYPIMLLHVMLIPDMRNQMDLTSCNEFIDLIFGCLRPDPVERFGMEVICYFLEKKLEIQLGSTTTPESSFTAEDNALQPHVLTIESMSSNTWKVNKLEDLRIGLRDIRLATNNFSEGYKLWSDHFQAVYKGNLEWFDKKYGSSLEGKNKGELPKRHYDVRIHINNKNAKAMFHKEIEILSTCKHDNIDSLLGFCDEDGLTILVYEGNTYNRLQRNLSSHVLTWDMRLQICLDVARGLNYLHNEMEDKKMVIHRQLSSFCIMLDGNWQGTKISRFGLSAFHENQDDVPLLDYVRKGLLGGGTVSSMAPEFREGTVYSMANATKESDIYSFGLVMFEILCGKDYQFLKRHDFYFQAEQWFKDRIIKQKVAQVLREENRDNKLFLKKGPNEDSLDTFIEIIEQCLVENPKQRPTLQDIFKQLDKALKFQKNHKDPLRMPFEVIKLATESFNVANEIGSGTFGTVYEGKLAPEHGSSRIVAKKSHSGKGDQQFNNELHILSEYKHENVIGLLGYNNDEQERIIVYEHASKGSLNKYLDDNSLTWINRLNICIDVARGLAFLHAGVREHEAVIHRDMKPGNILLFDDWKAKVGDFGLSLIYTVNDKTDFVIIHPDGTPRYLDPLYRNSRILTKESDIYSFGVVLFEILCGAAYDGKVKQHVKDGILGEAVFIDIKNQIMPEALATFKAIAYECLQDDRDKRPTAQHVLVELQKALELQVKDPVSKES